MENYGGASGKKGSTPSLFTKAGQGKLVVYDGEGNETPEGHIYTMLCALGPDKTLHTLYREGRRLKTLEILDFIIGIKTLYKNYLHVGFALGYDVVHWLHDLSQRALAEATDVDRPGVFYAGYYISYILRRELILKRGDTSVAIWDIFGFYQSSLVQSLIAWDTLPSQDLDIIKRGKEARGTFEGYTLADLQSYTRAELLACQALVASLCTAIAGLGLTLNRYDGAGALAASLYRANGISREWMQARQPAMTGYGETKELHQAIARAYFGGRIEAPQIGTQSQTIYDYDIRSAYPAALAALPDLVHGHWRYVPENGIEGVLEALWNSPSQIALFLVEWSFPGTMDTQFYPFPYRLGTSIYYPPEGKAWVWSPIVRTAMTGNDYWGEYDQYWTVRAAYLWEPGKLEYPFSWIAEAYDNRQYLLTHKPGGWNGQQRVLKLGLNSLYGKLCQRAGTRYEDDATVRPAFYNLAYAGIVTASTQAMLLDRALYNPEAIISFATDGILSTAPLGSRPTSENMLGGWSVTTHDALVMVYPGLYYLLNGNEWIEKSRGIRHATSQEEILSRIAAVQDGWTKGYEAIGIPARRFYGARLSIASAAAFALRGMFMEYERRIDLRGGSGKRITRGNVARKASTKLVRTSAVGWEFGLKTRLSDPAAGHEDSELSSDELEEVLETQEATWA